MFSRLFAYVLALEKSACQLFDLFAFREVRATRAREVLTRATNQRGRATTEASDQGSDPGLHVGFIGVGLQQQESEAPGLFESGPKVHQHVPHKMNLNK